MSTTFVEVTDIAQHRELCAAGLLWWEDALHPTCLDVRYVQLAPFQYSGGYVPSKEIMARTYGRFGYMVED